MKFIIDAQLPKALSDWLNSTGHDSVHTIELPKANATTDLAVIEFALTEDRIVISKDNDFLESLLLFGRPKKLILVKTGNIKNADLLSIFTHNIDKILLLAKQSSLIEISSAEIIAHV